MPLHRAGGKEGVLSGNSQIALEDKNGEGEMHRGHGYGNKLTKEGEDAEVQVEGVLVKVALGYREDLFEG